MKISPATKKKRYTPREEIEQSEHLERRQKIVDLDERARTCRPGQEWGTWDDWQEYNS